MIILNFLLIGCLVFVEGGPAGHLKATGSEDTVSALPCPDEELITPCHCYYDGDSNIDIDCSRVTSEDELKTIFSKTFPFTHFRSLNMNHNKVIKVLRDGDLGIYTFEYVTIHYGTLTTIEDNALINSRDILEKFDMWGNEISSIPDLSIYSKLTYIDFKSNDISTLPVMTSDTLQYLDLSHNSISAVPVDAVKGLTALQTLYLNVNSIPQIFSGTFTENTQLSKLVLNSNSIATIPVDSIKLNGPDSHLSLNSNQLRQIPYDAVSSVTGSLSLRANQLTQLPESDFKQLLQNNVKVYVEYNSFQCGCDIAWLILDDTLLTQITTGGRPTCSDGQAFRDLDKTFYQTMC